MGQIIGYRQHTVMEKWVVSTQQTLLVFAFEVGRESLWKWASSTDVGR